MNKQPPKAPKNYNMDGLLEIMRALRDVETGCAWDIEQTFESIGIYTIEEAYEVIDAINKKDYDALADELGDLLLQPIFHAQIAHEKGLFDFDKVVWNICDKMVRRHPHVFADKNGKTVEFTDSLWQKIKDEEKSNSPNKSKHLLDDIPQFPALKHAQKIQGKVATVGFDWQNIDNVKDKISEELTEFFTEIDNQDKQKQQQEFGDLLFSLVNYGRHLGLECDEALKYTNKKFINRFNFIEDNLKLKNSTLKDASLEELEQLWNVSKSAS